MGNFNRPYRVAVGIYDAYRQDGGNLFVTLNTNSLSLVGQSLKSGSNTPGFADRIRKGIDATTSYIREDYDVVAGFYRAISYSTLGNYTGFRNERFVYSQPDLSFNSSDVVNEASARLKRKLREFTGQSNQLTNLAELKDLPRTIGSIAGSASKLVNVVLSSKRRGNDLKKFASDQWLAWSFGALPTLAAVDDAISSINDYLSRGDHRIKEYGVHRKDWVSAVQQFTTGPYHVRMKMTGQYKHELSCKITAGYKFNLLSSEGYTPGKHLGFDITSVVPTAYELLPYSWLLDYFTTAGSFLEDTFSANPGQSIYLCQNVLLRVNGIVDCEPVPLFPGLSFVTDFYRKPCKFSYYKFSRTPLSNLPHAPLRFKTADEVAHNAVTKLLNLTALLGSKR